MEKIKLYAPCLFGLEGILANELKHNGFEDVQAFDGSVTFTGGMQDIARANILLRTAERVCIVVGEFSAVTFDELFENTKKLDWQCWIGRDDAFPVTGFSLKSQLHSLPDCQSIVKKAIVNKLSSVYKTDWFKETGAEHKIRFSILNDKVTVMLDTSGTGLHKRGYRPVANAAPLRETMAAGLVYISRYRHFEHFCDPLCGSGTIPIEAAMISANIAPGLKRSFAIVGWDQFPGSLMKDAREDAASRIFRDKHFEIYASDIDGAAIEIAKENARRAGVLNTVDFKVADVRNLKLNGDENNVIICNPPYGERMSELSEVKAVTKALGRVFENQPRRRAYIITSYEEFEKDYGKKADKNRKLYNGMIRTYLYQYLK